MNHPELLLLGLPVLYLVQKQGGPKLLVFLRVLLVGLVALALSDPRWGASGRDIVIVVDRSRSMPANVTQEARETIRLITEAAQPGDRVGVLDFARQSRVIQALSEDAAFTGFPEVADADGSRLGAALERALALIPSDRAGALLVISDGLSTDSLSASTAAARGIRIHSRQLGRSVDDWLVVRRLKVPEAVSIDEPVLIEGWIQADHAGVVPYRLRQNQQIIREGELSLTEGMNRVLWRDVLKETGIASYQLEVQSKDGVAEDDQALAALRVEGPRGVLLINDLGQPDALSASLQNTGLNVTVKSPEHAALDALSLESYRVVILENVAAGRLGKGLQNLSDFVEEQGGGLWVTGGPASFGVGGYYKSPIEKILPVSLELEQKQRNGGLALVVALDRSGSMGAEVGGGLRKMDLANSGAAAAISVLSSMDAVSVMAVDTDVWEIIHLQTVNNAQALQEQVRGIEVGGGGIYTNVAVKAASEILMNDPHSRRHFLLFADAADAEEHENVEEMVGAMAQLGITTSVVALGTPADSDGPFLEAVAKVGQGQMFYSTDAQELPRLFALDTMLSTESAFSRDPIQSQPQAGLYMLGGLSLKQGPSLGGHNRSQLRAGASVGLMTMPPPAAAGETADDPEPILAWHSTGLGRSAAFLAQIGGEYGAGVLKWPEFGRSVSTLVRWLGKGVQGGHWYAGLRREGTLATIEVEGPAEGAGELSVRVRDPQGNYRDVALSAVRPGHWEGHYDLESSGVYLSMVRLPEGAAIALPPQALPTSPEFVSLDPILGRRHLSALSDATGGSLDGPIGAVFDGMTSLSKRSLRQPLIVLALVALLLEISVRRLQLSGSLTQWAQRFRPAPRKIAAPKGPKVSVPQVSSPQAPPPQAPPPQAPPPQAPVPPTAAPDPMVEAMKKAKARADERIKR